MSAQTTTGLVISGLYGAGGNSGATLNADYIELFNGGTTTIDLSNYEIQYVSATGTSVTTQSPIGAGYSIAPGHFFLISATPGTNGSAITPTPDLVMTTATPQIAFAAGAGKVYLTNGTTKISTVCPMNSDPSVVDAIAYGATSCYLGTGAAPTLSTTTAAIRTNPCVNNADNSKDFVTQDLTASPKIRNSATTPVTCGASQPTAPTLTAAVSPTSVTAGNAVLLTAKVTKGTNSISTVTVDLSALGGSSTQTLYDDGTHGDVTAGDLTYSDSYTVPANQAANTYTLNFKVTDSSSLTGTGTASLTTTAGVTTTNPTVSNGTANPNPALSGGTVLLTAKVTAGTNPTSTSLTLTGDLSAFGGSTTQAFYDDGTHGDAIAGDGIYSYTLTVPTAQAAQSYTVNLSTKDSQLRTGTGTIVFSVQKPAATVVVNTSTSSAVVGASVTLSATVSGNNPSSPPSGTVNFYDNGTSLGQGTITSGQATYTTTSLALGSHTITASYSGDTNYPSVAATSSTSTTVNITAAPVPDFSISASNTNIILNDDQKTGTVSIAVNFVNGFSSPVALSCSGLPAGSRCAFSPTSLSANGNSIMTIAVDGASLAPHSTPFGKGGESALALTLLALPFALRRKVRARLGVAGTALGLLLFGAALFTATGCSNSVTTPASTSTITVTGTGGGVTHTTTLTLTAQ